jgi:hypothetical protein
VGRGRGTVGLNSEERVTRDTATPNLDHGAWQLHSLEQERDEWWMKYRSDEGKGEDHS